MATITFTDTTRTSTCLATGSGSASYTINRNTGAIETKLEVSKIEFTDQFGNLMRIISEPLISRNNGFWGIRIKVTVSVTDLYGGYFESSRSVPSGQSGGQFQNFSYTVPITWTYFSQALTAIKYDVTETSNQTSPLKTDYRQYETVLLRPSKNVTVQIGPNPLTDRITLNTEQNNQNNILINVEHRFRYYHLLSVQGNTNQVIVANLTGVTINGVKVDVCEAPALSKGTPPGVILPVILLKSILELKLLLICASSCGVAVKLGLEGSPVNIEDVVAVGAGSVPVGIIKYLIYDKETEHFKREDES
jgi:hypothetical protein